jgi:hypothetical protein
MLKLLLSALIALSLAGTPVPDGGWTWIEVDPNGAVWNTGGGRAEVVLEGARFEATLFDHDGAKVSILKGRADGELLSAVYPHSPTTGQNEGGLGGPYAGRRLEAFPQTSVVEGAPPPAPKRMRESIVLTRMDNFLGLTRK